MSYLNRSRSEVDEAHADTVEQHPRARDVGKELVREQVRQALFEQTTALPTVGRFVLSRKVGEGAMGVVYAAYDPHLQREVALKLLPPKGAGNPADATRRLLREARALARLTHPNVVTVHEVDQHDGNVVLVMELVQGPTLGNWLRRETHDFPTLATMLQGCADGVAAAHQMGLVHRDIKPDNILVGSDGRPRVGDFGLVRSDGAHELPSDPAAAGGSATASSVTQRGAMVGTPRYMSPEQLRGEVATAASDQFSFCATAFEALFGMRPFAPEDRDGLLKAIVAGDIARVAQDHPARRWYAALERGLRAEPQQRHPSMQALIAALPLPGAGVRPRSRLGLVSLVVSLVAMCVVVAAGWVYLHGADVNQVPSRTESTPPQRKRGTTTTTTPPMQREEGPATTTTTPPANKKTTARTDAADKNPLEKQAPQQPDSQKNGEPSSARADEEMYNLAIVAASIGENRECLKLTQRGPFTSRVILLRMSCAEGARDWNALKTSCNRWKQTYPQKVTPAACDDVVARAIALRKAGRAADCFALIEQASYSHRRAVHLINCFKALDMTAYQFRLCKYNQKGNPSQVCPGDGANDDKVIHIDP